MAFKPTEHPVLMVPTSAEAERMGAQRWIELVNQREAMIRAEKNEPLANGWEPPVWTMCDCLLGFEWVDGNLAEEVRRALGFEHAVSTLLINGGNRAGKSEYAAKRVQRVLHGGAGRFAWCLHSKEQMSVEYQQPLLWRYMPRELKRNIVSPTTYIKYKAKTGFSGASFILPNMSRCTFLNYNMEKDSAIEGGNIDICWPDELVPVDWVQTLELRIAERNGKMIITFTPINGYSPTVAFFQAGARQRFSHSAYLVPVDGGERRVDLELGVEPRQVEMIRQANAENRRPPAPWSVPRRVLDAIREERGEPREVPCRRFRKMPRVMAPAQERDPAGIRAMTFFFSSDNPYGNPHSVWEKIAGKTDADILERFYGLADRTQTARCPRFRREVHVIARAAVPEQGTNYLIADPSTGKNFSMAWIRRTPEAHYVYREWPGNYDIPGVGVPGPWTVPDSNKPDGKPGEAQKVFGFGLLDYKREIARLEGWVQPERAGGETEQDWVGRWTDEGARERVAERYIDSRFAAVANLEKTRPETLLEKFADVGMEFMPTPGIDIAEGVTLINDALSFDETRELDVHNQPALFVCEECINMIYALENWTGLDGQRGACKDFIDLLRYYFGLHPEYEDEGYWQGEGGGAW